MAPSVAENEDVAKLQEMAREFTLGFNTGDVNRIMRFYADRYVDVNLRNPVQTKTERAEYYRKIIERKDTRVEVHPDEILIEGNLAFVRGTIELWRTPQSGGSSERRELRYLEIARRQADGSWKVAWGMDGPVQEYDPSK
jgi:ketosteroid isomerase-like protein